MKVGENPQRGESRSSVKTARLFIVIYIPNLDGFFSNMEKILELSLDSLERTTNPDLGRITLISNACCPEIEALLVNRRSELFDQVILNKTNLGKIDGLLSAARGALEDVVIFSDCDVIFRLGWLEEIIRVFSIFPETGSVTPIASPRQYFRETGTALIDAMLKRELSIKKRMPYEDFHRLTDGTNNPEHQFCFINGQVTITRNNFDAGVGGGHQCVAFRKEMVHKLPVKPCSSLLEPRADYTYLDQPPNLLGYWRLSTRRNYAYHMGNVINDWVFDLQNEVEKDSSKVNISPLPPLRKPIVGYLPYSLRHFLARIVRTKFLRNKMTKNTQSYIKSLENAPDKSIASQD